MRAFARDTIAAASRATAVARVYVVTDEPGFEVDGAVRLPDEGDGDLNRALHQASVRARLLDPSMAVAAMCADLPCLDPDDLDAGLAAGLTPRWFVADASGSGTTLLAAGPGVDLDPHFGVGSARLHEAVRRQSGARRCCRHCGWTSTPRRTSPPHERSGSERTRPALSRQGTTAPGECQSGGDPPGSPPLRARAGVRTSWRPSWPAPSWQQPSWPGPSWPAPSWPGLLRSGLLGGRLLRGRLLGRGLLGSGLLGRAPSWPVPSWPAAFLAGAFFAAAFLAGAFFAAAFLAGAFLAGAFLAAGLLAAFFVVPPPAARFAAAAVRCTAGLAAAGVAFSTAARVSLGSFLAPDTTSLSCAPGLKAGTDFFLALIRAPVEGLRTHRASRTFFSKDPNPVMATFSPRATSRVIVSSTDSSACAAALRLPS